MTFNTTIAKLRSTRRLLRADCVLDNVLVDGEVPSRFVYLTQRSLDAILSMPGTPCDEDPFVPPDGQVRQLIGAFLRGKPMLPDRDYKLLAPRQGLWRWNTRTLRLGGMYLDASHFVLAHLEHARTQKRDDESGRSDPAKVRAFSIMTRTVLEELDLLRWAWITKDPHVGEDDGYGET